MRLLSSPLRINISYKLASRFMFEGSTDIWRSRVNGSCERARGLPPFYLGNYRKSDDGALKRFERTVNWFLIYISFIFVRSPRRRANNAPVSHHFSSVRLPQSGNCTADSRGTNELIVPQLFSSPHRDPLSFSLIIYSATVTFELILGTPAVSFSRL